MPPDGGKIVLLFHKFDVPGYNTTNGTCDGSYVEVLAGSKMVSAVKEFAHEWHYAMGYSMLSIKLGTSSLQMQ